MSTSSQLLPLASLACLLALGACAASPPRAATAAVDSNSPQWTGSLHTEFADTIDQELLANGHASHPDYDAWFAPRAQSADVVARVKVISTTTQGVGPVQGYRLTLQVLGPPLAGAVSPGDTREIAIPHAHELFPVARVHDLALTGKQFMGFFKQFAGPSAGVHWYLASDAPEVVAAAQRARTLREVGYRVPVPRM